MTHKTCDRTALDEIKTRKGGLHVLDAVAARVKLFEKGRLKFQEYLTPQELWLLRNQQVLEVSMCLPGRAPSLRVPSEEAFRHWLPVLDDFRTSEWLKASDLEELVVGSKV